MPGYKGTHRNRTTEEFLLKLKEYLKDEYENYDFSKVEYKGCHSQIAVICKKCGATTVLSVGTVLGLARTKKILCKYCKRKNNKYAIPTNEEFIQKLRNLHGEKYDYSKVNYISSHDNVIITCKKHNEEISLPAYYLIGLGINYCGCNKCKEEEKSSKKLTNFINKFNTLHPELKDVYSNIHFIENRKIEFICPIHGTVHSWTGTFLEKGCRKCAKKTIDRNYTSEEFIELLKTIYHDKYDYSKIEYKSYYDKVCLICKTHGEFWRLPSRLLEGRGCPKCKESLLENEILNFLDNQNIEYIYQYRNKEILGQKSIDFYLPLYHVGIECQGKQHFDKDSVFNKNIDIENIFNNDKAKYEICAKNNIKLYYFSHVKSSSFPYIDTIYNDKQVLLNTIIKEYGERLLQNTGT